MPPNALQALLGAQRCGEVLTICLRRNTKGSLECAAHLLVIGESRYRAPGPVLMHALPDLALPDLARPPPDSAALPDNLAASFGRYHDYLMTSAHPGEPRLGVVRVSRTKCRCSR